MLPYVAIIHVVGKLLIAPRGPMVPLTAKILHWSLPADLPAVVVTTDLPAGPACPIRGMPKKRWDANLYPNIGACGAFSLL
jgi:hypothetical protein